MSLTYIHSTFGVEVHDSVEAAGVDGVDSSSCFGAGPVCVIGTTRSVLVGTAGLRGAVTVNTPSDDNDDWTSFGFVPA